MPAKFQQIASFTLLELLVVISIIALLAGLLFPVLNKVQESKEATVCSSNLRQIGVGLTTYAADHNGYFPLSGGVIPYDKTGTNVASQGWTQQIEKYIGVTGTNTKIYTCPSGAKLLPENKPYSYFMGCFGATMAAVAEGPGATRQPLYLNKIQYPSKYILAGDIICAGKFSANDTDKDDNNDWNPAFSGTIAKIHNGKSNILFVDGHIAAFDKFDYANANAQTTGTLPMTVWYDKIADYFGKP